MNVNAISELHSLPYQNTKTSEYIDQLVAASRALMMSISDPNIRSFAQAGYDELVRVAEKTKAKMPKTWVGGLTNLLKTSKFPGII